jgi:drug/metabolite transporter (DMT)-like permease
MTVALGLGAAFMFAACDLSSTRVTRQIGAELAMMLILLLGFVPALVAMVAWGGVPTHGQQQLVLLIALGAGVCYYAGQVSLLRGVQNGNLSVVGPVASLEGGVATVVAFGLGERIGPVTVAGVLIAVLGAVITAREPGGGSARGVAWGIASACGFGLASVLWAYTDGVGASGAVALTRVGGLLLMAPLALSALGRRPASTWLRSRRVFGLVSIAAALELGAVAAAVASLAAGPIGVASVCQSQYGTAGALLGLVVLRERLSRSQLLGVGVVGIGVALMALG